MISIAALMLGMPTSENHYGEAVSAEKAPEAISTAVASLPPEQMYELMKQMKVCIQVWIIKSIKTSILKQSLNFIE